MLCINCGNEVISSKVGCSVCGYKFIADEENLCPNLVGTICPFTEEVCHKGEDFMICETKLQADKDSII